MDHIIRAVRIDLPCGNSKKIDLYKLQNNSFERRIGLEGTGESLGYAKNWLGRLPKQGKKQWNSMQDNGFTGYQIAVRVPHEQKSGAALAKTISIRDFNKILAYEAIKKRNLKAISLLVAFSEAGIERVINDAFNGVSIAWFSEKVVHYTQWTYEELEEVLKYNREEVKSLYPWSNEELVPVYEY